MKGSMCVAVLVVAVTLLAGGRVFAVTEMDISSLEQAAAQLENGKLRTNVVDGFIESISLVAPADRTPQDPKSDEELFDDFNEFLKIHWKAFRLDSPSDVGVLEVSRVMRDNPQNTSDVAPIPTAMMHLRQHVDGIPVIDQNLIVTFVNGDLRFVDGFLFPETHIREIAGANLRGQVTSYSTAGASVAALCPSLDIDGLAESVDSEAGVDSLLTGTRAEVDPFAGRLAYTFPCDGTLYFVDAVTAEVYSSLITTNYWSKHSGVTVKSVRDGGTFSPPATGPWFPIQFGGDNYPPAQMALHNYVLVDYEYSGWGCRFRYTYGGGSSGQSEPPFPATQTASGNNVIVYGDCTDGWSGTWLSTDPNFEYQTVHHKLATAARHTAWQNDLSLWKWWPPIDSDYLRVAVHDDPGEQACEGHNGRVEETYEWPYNTVVMCLNSAHDDYHRHFIPLHEYGHVIQRSYNLKYHSNNDELAVLEGVADALAVGFEHWRYNPLAVGSAADIDGLYSNGPGDGACRPHHVTGEACPNTPHLDLVVGVHYQCSGTECPYTKGLAISQIMWKLLNNRLCYFQPECNIGDVEKIEPYSWVLTDTQVARYARQNFTRAMVNMGSVYDTEEFLTRMLDYFEIYYEEDFSTTGWARLETAFFQHSVY
ncbi:hypothetical protein ACFL6C_05525 [Myxococcota bacterium]